MIVSPDFLDHWKTRMLCDVLADESAPLYVLRLWGHCQQRKAWEFNLPTAGLKAMCRYQGDAEAFESAMLDSGFISREGATVTVIGWEEYNSSLIASWQNGAKGGRPKKPTGNPRVTHGKPVANPDETDKRREDKIREDISSSLRSEDKAPRFNARAHLSSLGVSDQVAADWLLHRKGLKAAPTQTAIDQIDREARKARMSLESVLALCCQRGWKGFKADWASESVRNEAQEWGRKFQEMVNGDRDDAIEATARLVG